MKYLLLLALSVTAISVSLTGCGNDINHSHDIYRAQYNYKAPPPDTGTTPAPGTAAPTLAAPPPS